MQSMNARANINELSGLGKYLRAVFFGAVLLGSGLVHASTSGTPVAPLPVPAAKLTEIKVPGTTPMAAAAIDLAAAGYTEREFYADGKANRYRGVLPGTVTTGQIIDGDWPYRTRVLVRAPKAEKFNGFLREQFALFCGIFQIVYQYRLIGEQRNKPYDFIKSHLKILAFHQLFAEIGKPAVAPSDFLRRLGGEEHLIFFPTNVD